ncbi:DUF159 domain protein [Zymoseptoria brevis]|uniref:DUF159 domain protein n=1 Tax=Zymoseptoria brevis TaxID=1047168 RepID=A0A0F4GU45_9PEZI|nr:DUF159 domain protein [Zymoseptoria brevis]
MCGRYVLSMRPGQYRQRLVEQDMPVEEAPNDEEIRSSYNFAPSYHGLIYRANTSGRGGGDEKNDARDGEPSPKKAKLSHPSSSQPQVDGLATKQTKYKLQAAKWGLIPFWTKRPPDYASQMRTINCRDDSLIENRGLWNTMKQRKRCIVIAEGFYEWLKKNGGKVPHYTKRKDGQLMCFAGLWDMVQYEDSEEKLYTYTVITTDSNSQLKFLHDRMPVILEPGSEQMRKWLDPSRVGWDKELQGMLKPFEGELECYPVDQAVGKVGNNSPSFLIPIDSKENKKNIANFFGTQRATAKEVAAKNEIKRRNDEEAEVERDPDEERETTMKIESTEDNAPLPKPKDESERDLSQRIEDENAEVKDGDIVEAMEKHTEQSIKRELSDLDDASLVEAAEGPPKKAVKTEESNASPSKSSPVKKPAGKKTRSAVSNEKVAKTPTKGGNAKITSFFGK